MFSTLFGSYFSNSANLVLKVSGSNTLASASSYVFDDPGFGNGEVVRTKLVSEGANDLNGASADGVMDVNFGYNWQLDSNTAVSGTELDFFAALFHELTHALGFSSSITQDGQDPFGNGQTSSGGWSKFDQFMTNCAGTDLVDHASKAINQGVYDAARTSAMCFNGDNAKAANGGNPVDLYAPNPYSDGSSGSHLNTDNPAYANSMMKHDRDFGPAQRNYSLIEVGMLTDIGYTRVAVPPNNVPEPGTLALLFAAAGVASVVAKRRKA